MFVLATQNGYLCRISWNLIKKHYCRGHNKIQHPTRIEERSGTQRDAHLRPAVEAMQIAKAHKCLEYDMFGIAPNPDPSHPIYGLYKFKQGFGGNIFHQLGCWDYPIDNDKYSYFAA